MYRLNLPSVNSKDAYDISVSSIRDDLKRGAFENSADEVLQKCIEFDRLALDLNFGLAESHKFNIDTLGSIYSMADLYDKQFTNSVASRAIRDSIVNAAPNSLCPYCGEGVVSELDHYLPKSRFAGITVHPANLVPTCKDCNYAKRAHEPSSKNNAVLHPYFDSSLDVEWLEATIYDSGSGRPIVQFSVKELSDNILNDRLNTHLEVFKLKDIYREKAAQLLGEYEDNLRNSLDPVAYINSLLNIRPVNKANSWKLVTFRAMLKSDWYINTYLKTTNKDIKGLN